MSPPREVAASVAGTPADAGKAVEPEAGAAWHLCQCEAGKQASVTLGQEESIPPENGHCIPHCPTSVSPKPDPAP